MKCSENFKCGYTQCYKDGGFLLIKPCSSYECPCFSYKILDLFSLKVIMYFCLKSARFTIYNERMYCTCTVYLVHC